MVASESMINQPKLSVCREALDESRDGLGSQLGRFILGAAMKEILLTKGAVAIVDNEGYEWISQQKWYAYKNKSGNIYAMARRHRSMHRDILAKKIGRA